MDTTYLVEIRLARTKWRIKKTIVSISGRFRLGQHMERHPHITIFGPLVLNDGISEELLLSTLGEIVAQYDPLPFLLDGWEKREGIHGSVLAFPVLPSDALVSLTTSAALALLPLSESLNHWDSFPDRKWFHVTIANRLDDVLASEVFSWLNQPYPASFRHHPPDPTGWQERLLHSIKAWFSPCGGRIVPAMLDDAGLRLTVMKGENILAEYDFIEKCWIRDDHDHSGRLWQKTLRAYRHYAGFERLSATIPPAEEIYVISDLHLGHANIIRYCSRPFLYSDVGEMDAVLTGNWNSVISPATRVYHIGDLRYGKEALPLHHYRQNLQGTITFIKGNHDDEELGAVESARFDYDGISFLLLHDPADAPPSFDGWIIHGHHHNNDLRRYPFLNFIDRRVNVSAEVIGYVPISLSEICSRIRDHRNSGDTRSILLRYPYVSS